MCELSAYEDWKSLFTDETKRIWQQERDEFRRLAMIFHIMREEFNRIEDRFRSQMKKLEDGSKVTTDSFPENEMQAVLIHESPKINRRRPLKHLSNSPSLLTIPKEKSDFSEHTSKQKIQSFVLDSSSSEEENNRISETKPKNLFKRSKTSGISDDLLVDCSLIVDETPINSNVKKSKMTEDSFKWIQTKNKNKFKQCTIKKMLLSGTNKRKSKGNLSKYNSFDTDKTYFAPLENDSKVVSSKSNAFSDYDAIPKMKSNSPQHVHKTEVVRKKSERMQLPGWSCGDCEKFYESLDLSPTQLKQKMDMCSKHRNKFPPLCATPQGYWDVTMPPTQDTDPVLL